MRPTALTGLAAEAKILRRRGIPVFVGARAATLLIDSGAEAVLSFGIAGGLDPALASGTLLLPRRVRDEGGRVFAADAAWREQVLRALASLGLATEEGDLLGLATVAVTREEKDKLRAGGAVAVDLESHIAGAAAQRADRPFLVLRAVADPAGFALPPAAAVGLDEHGRVAPGAVLRSLLQRPEQLPALLRLAAHTRAAFKTLARAAAAL
jgi:hopanoid-associated phosphorylase